MHIYFIGDGPPLATVGKEHVDRGIALLQKQGLQFLTNVSEPILDTHPKHTRIFEWCVVKCGTKNVWSCLDLLVILH